MEVPIERPHKVIDAQTGQATVYLGMVSFKVGPEAQPQPAKER